MKLKNENITNLHYCIEPASQYLALEQVLLNAWEKAIGVIENTSLEYLDFRLYRSKERRERGGEGSGPGEKRRGRGYNYLQRSSERREEGGGERGRKGWGLPDIMKSIAMENNNL